MPRHRHHIMLAAPGVGLLQGTYCTDRKAAKLLMSDRIANGDAFAGELVVRVPDRAMPDHLLWPYRAGWTTSYD